MSDILNILQGGLKDGIIWGILVIGVYISFRILDIADLSIEGTFPLGGCVAAILIFWGVNPYIATILAFVFGLLGGLLTGVIHTKLKVPAILSGIITMTALSSINLVILGFASKVAPSQANLPITNDIFVHTYNLLEGMFKNLGIEKQYANIIVTLVVSGVFLLLVAFLVYWLFGTEVGMNVRATGNNQRMARAQGINTDLMIIFGLMLSNGLIALSGALFAQNGGTAIVDSGKGAIVIGLASIILGELIFGKKRSFKVSLISIIVGAIIFFIIKAIAITLNVDHLLNLLVAIMLTVILALPLIKKAIKLKKKEVNDDVRN